MKEQLFFIGVKGLIQNHAGEYLILLADVTNHSKNTEPYWDIPGGRVEKGSTFVSTLVREILEETGVTVNITDIRQVVALISKHQIPTGDELAGLALVVYNVHFPDDADIRLSSEHERYEWVAKDEAKLRLSNKYPHEFTDQL